MSKLSYLPTPLWSPPPAGPWTLRWTRPDGSTFRYDDHPPESGRVHLFDSLADAERWRAIAERGNREGCRVEVVPARRAT